MNLPEFDLFASKAGLLSKLANEASTLEDTSIPTELEPKGSMNEVEEIGDSKFDANS